MAHTKELIDQLENYIPCKPTILAAGQLRDFLRVLHLVSDSCGPSSNWNGKTQEFLIEIEKLLNNE